ncbi:EamA domain-containing membrane protein RarD [Peptoclostridium litorale DSM 5388]|uniref:EamA domain-containing protein n=1 Tax=Peptoclostridium litorale DSM 5388 TaxID=1121324 RepID=A0A069RJV7_PEPLI|nr:DMT family transporter [Peptoclostridium litorale]KDR96425.1 hypothetical protein CLIT_2c00310 [Peptoclostridium litorale DSM 5388]SIN70741.1 EamA domain-containing membrane protein RarD [Peptoclostridium litorale DSM 5388]
MLASNQKKGYLMVASASVFWGTLGLFTTLIFSMGLAPSQTAFWRMFFGFLFLFLYILSKNKGLYKIDAKGLVMCGITGLFCHTVFNIFYMGSIQKTSIATAAVLLYTAPAFVILMSSIFFREKLTSLKLAALAVCLSGAFLTATGGSLASLSLNMSGVLMGLGAGFSYAMITIMTKAFLCSYNPLTTNMYVFAFTSLFLIPVSNPVDVISSGMSPKLIVLLACLGLFPTAIAYAVYTAGLSKPIESSRVGIICTLELVVSVFISLMFFSEDLSPAKLAGIALVMASVLIVQLDRS